MYKALLVFIVAGLCLAREANGQIIPENDESRLYARTKQVNQFFRRFNGEEDEKGVRFYPGDKQYRSVKLRKKYLGILFDESNEGMSAELKTEFAKNVLDKSEPGLLDFHKPDWFCEVHATFNFRGKRIPVILFMELEKAQLGSKWVIARVNVKTFEGEFRRDTVHVGKFLHPLSHELEFMNLRKALLNTDSVSQFASRKFVPDYLTLFFHEIHDGNLKFESVDELRFHFFQIPGWYFELSQFNRTDYNAGWLISSLVKLNSESDKAVMRKYVYYENR